MSHKAIRLGDSNDFIELRCLEVGKAPGMSDGDLRLGVSVQDNDCAASYEQVWIAKDDWTRFLARLSQLEREREGHAALLSMSPDEFELHLVIHRRGGTVDAHGFLSRYHFHFPGGTAQSRVYFSLPVDPSMLRRLTESFAALGEQKRGHH
jgi:hypothetical protein